MELRSSRARVLAGVVALAWLAWPGAAAAQDGGRPIELGLDMSAGVGVEEFSLLGLDRYTVGWLDGIRAGIPVGRAEQVQLRLGIVSRSWSPFDRTDGSVMASFLYSFRVDGGENRAPFIGIGAGLVGLEAFGEGARDQSTTYAFEAGGGFRRALGDTWAFRGEARLGVEGRRGGRGYLRLAVGVSSFRE